MVDFAHARRTMIENQIKTSGITDHRLLSAMGRVPREIFVPEARRDLAYIDAPHRLDTEGGPRFMPPPAPFAKLAQLANISHKDNVLVVGCTTGYSAAVLSLLADRVVAVEDDAGLVAAARDNLKALGSGNVDLVQGPLLAGAAGRGPYDVIVVDGAIDAPPESLFSQLKTGGNLVALMQAGRTGTAYLYTKSATDVAGTPSFNTSMPPLHPSRREDAFVF